MRLLIGTPAYGGMVHLDYVNSLLDFQKNGLNFALASIGNESLITRARNSIISYFYHHQAHFTHLLFLDADVNLAAKDLRKLLDFDKDVIGAPVPLKSYWPDGSPKYNFAGYGDKVEEHLFTTPRVGTAVLLLSRKAVLSLVEKAKQEQRLYRNWHGYDNKNNITEMEMYDVFQVGVVDGEYLSEDYWICRQLLALDYKIHVADNVIVTHHGMHAFKPEVKSLEPGTDT